jgi:hypothetical protein
LIDEAHIDQKGREIKKLLLLAACPVEITADNCLMEDK